MATLQEEARALGDPTRHDIFKYIVAAPEPVGIAELTDHFGLNHNAIRQHLAKLLSAALVTEARAPSVGRGRPRLVYRMDPAADSRWGVVGPYERVSVLLAEILQSGDSPVDVGRRWPARQLQAPEAGTDPVAFLADAMERQGFAPEVRRGRGKRVEVVLQTCPLASAVLADPDAVCGLHLGIAEGVVAMTGGLVVDELVRHDPRRAKCRLRMRLEEPADV
jgi:predicted ArsR family transcriptional regulator